MKRCPQCNRVEPDGLLKFCRVDGVALVEDVASDESSATRILPTSPTDEALILHPNSGDAPVTTTRLEQKKEPKRERDKASTRSRSAGSHHRELRRAIELSPSLAIAHQYLAVSFAQQGRLDETLGEILKARELDPLSSIIARNVGAPYYFKRDYGRALELVRQGNELGPTLTTTWEIGVYIQNRLFNEAFAELEKAKRERKDDPILIYSTGMVYAAQGKRAEALQITKELEAMSGANLAEAHWIAKIYATLNEKEMAFSWLDRGLATGAIGVFYKDEPVWDPIRSDPRFADLLRRMGIPQ